jgi:hypothetical protein
MPVVVTMKRSPLPAWVAISMFCGSFAGNEAQASGIERGWHEI